MAPFQLLSNVSIRYLFQLEVHEESTAWLYHEMLPSLYRPDLAHMQYYGHKTENCMVFAYWLPQPLRLHIVNPVNESNQPL